MLILAAAEEGDEFCLGGVEGAASKASEAKSTPSTSTKASWAETTAETRERVSLEN
tara:strand:- start:357 stop:524 length:168 start_codon:yes stop_codon:yes gene_type:complete